MKQFLLILFLSSLHFSSIAQKDDDGFFENADTFFRKYIWDGKVNYKAISKNRLLLDSLVKQIALFEIDKSNPMRNKSFYINAYNLLVIKNVVKHYPITSVKEVTGFFDNYKFNVAGKKMSLNQLQYNTLIKKDKDVRLLFSLSNGSVSSSPIYNVALSKNKQLSVDIENRMTSFINETSNVQVNDENKTVVVSQLFKWYETAIVSDNQTITTFINKFRKEKIPNDYAILYDDYDWSLNDMNEKTGLNFSPMETTSGISVKHVSLTYNNSNELKLIDSSLVFNSGTDLNTKIIRNGNLLDEELGFRNESRFIESKSYEFRLTDKFYTQKDYFNKRMLRVSSDYRTTYNDVNLSCDYAFNRKLQGGFIYNTYKSYNDDYNAKATDFFSVSGDKKLRVSEMEFFIKHKFYEKQYRISSFAYLTLPLAYKRPNDKIAASNKYYDAGLIGYYDGYPTSFMRMILSGEFISHYSITKEKTTFEFNPESRFIFTLFRSKPVMFTAVMDLLFSINKNKTSPFITVESLAANIIIWRNLDCNLMYQYYALGKSTGAGQAFKLELLYALK